MSDAPKPGAVSYFKKATKSQAKAKVALTGPSGSGKTLSSLLMAKGLTNSGRVAVIDTENSSASLYEDRFPAWDYFTLSINPPYTAQKYLKAIDIAIAEGFDAIVIDSLSHVWDAEGGLKQQKDALDSRGGNTFANWAPITKLYEQLKAKILHSNIHMVVTMRSKQEYILEKGSDGKSSPRKVGLAPVMRDGMEYEFTVVFDIGMDHQFMVSKDRTDLFDGVVDTVSENTGSLLKNWLKAPAPVIPPPPKVENPNFAPCSQDMIDSIYAMSLAKGIKPIEINFLIAEGYLCDQGVLPPVWVAIEILKLLDNEDCNPAVIVATTTRMIDKRGGAK